MQMDWGGVKGGVRETGRGRGNGRERGSAVEERQNRSKWNTSFFFCYCTWPNGKSFVTPNIQIKPAEPFKQLNNKKEDSAVRLVSRASHDWRLMRHVTLLEEDTHGRDCEWQGAALEFALPLQLPQTFISSSLEMRGKKKKKLFQKHTRYRGRATAAGKFSPRRGDKQVFHRSLWLSAPPDRRQLFRRPSPQIWGI